MYDAHVKLLYDFCYSFRLYYIDFIIIKCFKNSNQQLAVICILVLVTGCDVHMVVLLNRLIGSQCSQGTCKKNMIWGMRGSERRRTDEQLLYTCSSSYRK